MHEVEGTPGGGHAHPHRAEGGEGHAGDGRPRLAFVGAGRVGRALGLAFQRAGWPVTGVASRDEGRRTGFTQLVPGARAFAEAHAVLDEADLIFLTVPDDAIAPVAASLKLYSGQALVHTSGALPAAVLHPAMAAGTAAGSFHPLVAFADLERALRDLTGATIGLEGDETLLPLLAEMAESVGAQPVLLPAQGKAAYHAAAMLAAGGLIGLLDAVAEVARAAGLDEAAASRIYGPLARQALGNADELGIDRALTGPFLRGDAATVRGHLEALTGLAPTALPLYLAVARRELAIARRRGELSAEASQEIERLLEQAAEADDSATTR
jgi:predicted short-subunit dehydrogenase-like oxidoreductase (DUF2520 family)